jgi:hypothetical protein
MNGVKRRMTTESGHKEANCFLLLIIRLEVVICQQQGIPKWWIVRMSMI